ncbi:MAG: 2OG-Fe(II) oxygenase [Hyphomicrobium sp.]
MPVLAKTSVADQFLDCLARSRHATQPFDYWLLDGALPEEDIDAVVNLPFAPPGADGFNGRRETNNSARTFFSPENQAKFPVIRRIADGFKDPRVIDAIKQTTRANLADTRLRIEYCQDAPGFWLEPHTDISVKKFTMLVYLSGDPKLRLAGTDIHEGPPDYEYVTTAPYGRNLGVIFVPAGNTWHGVGHHPLTGLRKSIIINYVTADWRDTFELA